MEVLKSARGLYSVIDVVRNRFFSEKIMLDPHSYLPCSRAFIDRSLASL